MPQNQQENRGNHLRNGLSGYGINALENGQMVYYNLTDGQRLPPLQYLQQQHPPLASGEAESSRAGARGPQEEQPELSEGTWSATEITALMNAVHERREQWHRSKSATSRDISEAVFAGKRTALSVKNKVKWLEDTYRAVRNKYRVSGAGVLENGTLQNTVTIATVVFCCLQGDLH